ncbi:hypothetical protein H4R20_001573 [Coemansia guatemalensis]|uniref:PCI domain-containing protein n=1 Tax=Coemansia guatemalensis TaxID=2761395 RepID=A0A9W8LUS9_9FUNG|nr:hypothetical protein H4R20_001573 [Coemansia guatemalensis]
MDEDVNPVASAFVNSAQEAFMFENGEALAKLFVFNEQTVDILGSKLSTVDDFDQYVIIVSDPIFAQFTATYLRFVRDKPSQSPEDSHKILCKTTELFIAILNSVQGPWLLPVVRSIALAQCASAQTVHSLTGDSGAFTQSASLLLRLLIDLLSDNSPIESSKKLGALFVAGLLLRISLRTNAAPGAYASKALEVKSLWDTPAFSRRDRASYSFWLGRYYLVCYYVDLAREQLEYAFNACPGWHYHNKRVILRHLFVANMIRGRLPSVRLLEKYDMEPVYGELVQHFRKGNLAGFQQALADNMDLFRSQGNFLILLERTKLLIYRNVLQRLRQIVGRSERSKVISYRDMLAAFRVASQDPEMDVFEMESILSSLISQKIVRGFMFHHQKSLNLSQKDPFPSIMNAGKFMRR